MSNQTDEQKQQIVMKFANEVQPKVFPLLAPTDHNVSYFQAIIEANWTAEFSVEYLANAIRYFRDKFQWLAEPSGKPVLSRAQRLAAVGLSENDLERRGERWDKKAERIKNEAEQARQEYESETNNILAVKTKAEELARTANIGSHSDNAAFRKLLSETFAHENGKLSWFRTLELREQLYKDATSGSVSMLGFKY